MLKTVAVQTADKRLSPEVITVTTAVKDWSGDMLLTDCKRLYRKAVKVRGLKFCEAAKLAGISDSNVRTSLTYQIVNKNYIRITEAIGYDIKLTLVPRQETNK